MRKFILTGSFLSVQFNQQQEIKSQPADGHSWFGTGRKSLVAKFVSPFLFI